MSMHLQPPATQVVQYGDGPPGRGITKCEIVDGNLILYFTDQTVQIVGRVVGKDGEDGRDGEDAKGEPGKSIKGDDGRGIVGATLTSDGCLELAFTDKTTQNVGYVRGEPGKGLDGRSVTGAEMDGDGNLVIHYSDKTHDNVGRVRGEPGKTGRFIAAADIRNGHLIFTFSDKAEMDLGKIVPEVPVVRDGVDGRSVEAAEIDADGFLWLKFSKQPLAKIGRVRGNDGISPEPHPAPSDGVGIAEATVTDGDLLITLTNSRVINAGRVKGDTGDVTVVQASAPKGRTLYGKTGRLTSDRKPPSATNTLNIPDSFARAVTLLVSDGATAGARIEGLHACTDGIVTWEEWSRAGNAPVIVAADQDNRGLAVTAKTLGSWTCRMIGSPE